MSDIEKKSELGAHKPANADEKKESTNLSRRNFLKIAGGVVLVSSIGIVAGCDTEPTTQTLSPVNEPTEGMDNIYPDVPVDPMIAPPADVLHVFTLHEAKTVEALTARIMPGTPDDPGAREAGVVTFIDNMLTFNEGFNDPTYRQAPYAEVYEGDQPPSNANLQGQYQVVYVSKDEIDRYGFQSIMSPRETYRMGLTSLDNYSQSKFKAKFVDLDPEDQQDQIVDELSNDKADNFSNPSGPDFFDMVRTDTINGMFSDPGYGGNTNMVGWNLIGYPGAQRAYTEAEIRTEGHVRPPQSLAQMHEAHPGQAANSSVILPQSGSHSSDSATMQAPMQH